MVSTLSSTQLPYSFFFRVFFFKNFTYLFTLHLGCSPSNSSPASPNPTNLSLLPFPSEQGKHLLGYHSALGYQVSAGLHAPTEGQPGSLASRRISNGRQWSQRHLPFQYLGDPHDEQAVHRLRMGRTPRSSPHMLCGWWLSPCEHPWTQVS